LVNDDYGFPATEEDYHSDLNNMEFGFDGANGADGGTGADTGNGFLSEQDAKFQDGGGNVESVSSRGTSPIDSAMVEDETGSSKKRRKVAVPDLS